MSRTWNAEIVLDSFNSKNERITTFEITMWKLLVAEFNTHRSVPAVTRQIARNSASSRAIPTSTIINEVMSNPVIPLDFRTKNTGMIAVDGTQLSGESYERAVYLWLKARDQMVAIVREMMAINEEGIDKQRVNRLLEAWMWTVIVATACDTYTEKVNRFGITVEDKRSSAWKYFFELRDHPAAQPEFAHVANIAHIAFDYSVPKQRTLHLPYTVVEDYESVRKSPLVTTGPISIAVAFISAARCGRVSYYNQGKDRGIQEDYDRGIAFRDNKHSSPLEHPNFEDPGVWHGPFYGWEPLREAYE